MRHLAPALALTLSLAIPVVTAHAAETTFKACAGAPSKADEDAAKGLFAAGKTAYEEGDYTRAIQYWRDAFDRDCTANPLLLNLANAYERSGNIDAAIASLETYLKRKPDAGDAPTIQKRIENMKKTRKDAAPIAPPPPTTAKTAAPPPTTAPTSPPPTWQRSVPRSRAR